MARKPVGKSVDTLQPPAGRRRLQDARARLQGARTGRLLIDALQASPHREIDIEPCRCAMPVRDVEL